MKGLEQTIPKVLLGSKIVLYPSSEVVLCVLSALPARSFFKSINPKAFVKRYNIHV